MTQVKIVHKDKAQTEIVELASAGHVRVEIDAEAGIISRALNLNAIVGIELVDKAKKP